MPYNGSGTFVRVYSWQTDKINGIKIRADRTDGEDDGFATGLSTAICKDGQSTPTANIGFGGFRLTSVGAATARTDAMRVSHEQDADLISYTAAGTDTYTITPVPAVTSYTTYQSWRVLFTNANTGAATLNVNGVGAKAIKKNGSSALVSGDIPAGSVVLVSYDGTNFVINGILATQSLNLIDGGLKTSNFAVSANTKYRMKGTASAIVATLPTGGTAGDIVLLVPYGSYGGQACGTINGTSQTIQFEQQSQLLTYTLTIGWV